MDRIIGVKVGGNYISKDNKNAGVTGEANVTMLRITFDEGWDSYAKTVTFFDAHGKNPVKRIQGVDLIEDIAKDTRTYITPIPKEPLAIEGEMTFVIDGYLDGKRQRSISASLMVKHSPETDNAEEPTDPTPSQAEQLQGQIDIIINTIQGASIARDEAEVSAKAAKESAESAANAINDIVGDLGDAKEGYSPANVIDYINLVEANIEGTAIEVGRINREMPEYVDGKVNETKAYVMAQIGDLDNIHENYKYEGQNLVSYVNDVVNTISGGFNYFSGEIVSAYELAESAYQEAESAHQEAESANQKVGDLGKIPDDYTKTDLVSYINDVASLLNILGYYAHVTLPEEIQNNMDSSFGNLSDSIGNPYNIPADYSNLIDYVKAVDAALAKKQDKEHVWTLMYDEVLAEDRGSNNANDKLYALDLNFKGKQNNSCGSPNPTTCIFPKYAASLVGLRVSIVVPTAKAFGGGTILTIRQNNVWAQNYNIPACSANTARDKLVNAQWIIEHGVSEAKCLTRTGQSLTQTTIGQSYNAGDDVLNGFFPAEYYAALHYRGALPAGAEIKVWGLFN